MNDRELEEQLIEKFTRVALSRNGEWAVRGLRVLVDNNPMGATIPTKLKELYNASFVTNLTKQELDYLHKEMPKHWRIVYDYSEKGKIPELAKKWQRKEFRIDRDAPKKLDDDMTHLIIHSATKKEWRVYFPFNKEINKFVHRNGQMFTYVHSRRARVCPDTTVLKIEQAIELCEFLRDLKKKFPVFYINQEDEAMLEEQYFNLRSI